MDRLARHQYDRQHRIRDDLGDRRPRPGREPSKDLPQTPTLSFDATYVPAALDSSVGGDWYDVFRLPSGQLGFSIGDVTGHGFYAAAATSRAREAIVATAFERRPR